jgi:outer membrane protein assembly factor BamB
MNAHIKAPCAVWAEKLALLHPDDLLPTEWAALEAHVASCSACASVRRQYTEIARLLRDLPVDDVPQELPSRLVGLWEEEDKRQQVRGPLLFSPRQARPKRSRGAYLLALLSAAALIVTVVLGSIIAHMTSMQPGSQVNFSGPNSPSGGKLIVYGRFFTIHQSVIYVTSGSGKLLALRSDNGVNIRSYTVGDGKALGPPIIAESTLYDSDLNTLYALRVSDGSVVWHTAFGDHLAIASPSIADGIVYITTSDVDHQIYALRASNGAVLWHYKTRGVSEGIGPLVVVNGIVYFGSSDTKVQHVYALDEKNGELLWSHKFTENNGPRLLVNDGMVIVLAGNGIFALGAGNGTLLWTYRVDTSKFLETSGIAGSFLYTLGDNGYVYALRIEDGRLQWSSKIAEHASSASPIVLVNGMIFVASFGGFNLGSNNPKTAGGNLYALHADNGRIIWQKYFGSNDIPIMAVDHSIIYVASQVLPNDTLYALRTDDGSTIWNKSLNGL